MPAGEDQLPMIEQTNEIVTKINSLIGQPVLTTKVVVGQVGRLPGTDGSGKMSKSLGNTINLSSTADEIKKRFIRCIPIRNILMLHHQVILKVMWCSPI